MNHSQPRKPDFYLVVKSAPKPSEMKVFSCYGIKRVGVKDKGGFVNRGCLLMRVEPPMEYGYIDNVGWCVLPPNAQISEVVVEPRHGMLFPVMEWPVNVTLIYPNVAHPEWYDTFEAAPNYLCEEAGLIS